MVSLKFFLLGDSMLGYFLSCGLYSSGSGRNSMDYCCVFFWLGSKVVGRVYDGGWGGSWIKWI